ncbi:MAG: efflux transporter periplasmic adaptor subunit [Alcanivorax sp.]|nr:efflux transporter periplasmic adaptor subunit [Alcanivorax sp.]MAY09938.1 efflux transporter periplasmic adaptor subunit [Alcanivorax sp.]MBI56255.1 efflux transporter periplasmic adaptor subunit [Alcanivorax sp.]MBU58945.1 efflux transporter periplasmic adaptor subunit [Alcanivorax sp.]HCE41847.1 efflux transporter periplasmic adaptor subunit [Alcanivorax sp.]|tara:strand:- start:9485 stop:10663 length:1179 start_codon:yes stop_codon:yes gene_type:complete
MESVNEGPVAGVGVYWGLMALLASALLLAGCDARQQAEGGAPPAPEVDVAEVLVRPATLKEVFTGRLSAPETVQLRSRVSGYIEEVAFEEGERVEAGDLLFRIDARPYQARVDAARAALEQARSDARLAGLEADRARKLLDSRAISREEFDRREAARLGARARVAEAKASLTSAELDLSYTRVTSPVTGRAGRALVTKGNLASADQTLLTTVVSVDPLHVYFDSNESDALNAQRLMNEGKAPSVAVGMSGESGFPHAGRLDFVDNQMNPDTGTLRYRAVLPNPNGIFKPGQFARVEMPVARLEQAILISRKAVLTDQDRRYVYVVGEDNTTARRAVKTGRELDDLVVVREGLEPGDRVIVNGTQKVFMPGMPVQPNTVSLDEPAGGDLAGQP